MGAKGVDLDFFGLVGLPPAEPADFLSGLCLSGAAPQCESFAPRCESLDLVPPR